MKIQGARVVVTGGGRGLGREFAMQFLDAGARVMVCDVVAFTIALFIVENDYSPVSTSTVNTWSSMRA